MMIKGSSQLIRKLKIGDASCPAVIQSLRSVRIIHQTGLVDGLVIFCREYNLIVLDLYLIDLFIISHLHKSVVIHFLHCPLYDLRYQKTVDQDNHDQCNHIIEYERFFVWLFDFLHTFSLSHSCIIVQICCNKSIIATFFHTINGYSLTLF